MAKATQLIAIFFISLALIFVIINLAAAIALGIAGIIALISSKIVNPSVRTTRKQADRHRAQQDTDSSP
jgi:membrane-bound ClpP family serine protease